MTNKKKPHRWGAENDRQFETPHSTKSVAYWLSQYTAEGVLFVRTSLKLMYQQTDKRKNGSVKRRNNGGFSAASRDLAFLAKKCVRNQSLSSKELNDAREKLKKCHLAELTKLWNSRYVRRKAA